MGILRHFGIESYEDLVEFKIFLNIVDFPYVIFWAQNVLIHPAHMRLCKCWQYKLY